MTLEEDQSLLDLANQINGIVACLKGDIQQGIVRQGERRALLAFFKGFCKRNGLNVNKFDGVV